MSLESPPNDRSWVALHIYDTFYPLTEEMSFPEALMSLEIISQLHKKRKAIRDAVPRVLRSMFGYDDDHYGERSSEGHYMMWIHLSDRLAVSGGIEKRLLDNGLGHTSMYPDRTTDLFTGWSGETNIAGLLTQGMAGLAKPVKRDGRLSGQFQSLPDAVKLGEADYEAGWFISDDQACRLLEAFLVYPGVTDGYSFLRSIEERPNTPYEPEGKMLVNGYNCGDFAWFALDHAGIVLKEVSEQLKIRLWYPSSYYDRPLPLSSLGQKGADWVLRTGSAIIPDEVIARFAWKDLLLGYHGVEFFDKKRIVEDVVAHRPEFHAVRIWEHANVIDWLKEHADFHSKGVATELLPAVQERRPIFSPHRTIGECKNTRYILSPHRARHQEIGDMFRQRKLAKAGLHEDQHEAYRRLEEGLYKTY